MLFLMPKPDEFPLSTFIDNLCIWARVPHSNSVTLHKNGLFETNSLANLQSRRALFKNISAMLISGRWNHGSDVEKQLRRLEDATTRLWNKSFHFRITERAYTTLKNDLATTQEWIETASKLYQLLFQLQEHLLTKQKIAQVVVKLKNETPATFPQRYKAFNEISHRLRTQTLTLALTQLGLAVDAEILLPLPSAPAVTEFPSAPPLELLEEHP